LYGVMMQIPLLT